MAHGHGDSKTPTSRVRLVVIAISAVAIFATTYFVFDWLRAERRKALEYELKRIGLLYHVYYATHDRAPGSLADLESFTDPLGFNPPSSYEAPRAIEMIRNGRLVVIWNAVLSTDLPECVLGYESNAPEDGGLVILGNGLVRSITAEKFNALPKIKTRAN